MNYKTRQDLFERYFHYYIVKLEINKKYKFILKKDNRINALACVQTTSNKNEYSVTYNLKRLTTEWKIIQTVLHEIRHLFHDFRYSTNDVEDEWDAEYFALSTIKKEYPHFYRRCVNWTKKYIVANTDDYVHKQGYFLALQELKEI